MRVAEQVAVESPPELVASAFRTDRVTWMHPLLAMAWGAGETETRRRGVAVASVAPRRHRLSMRPLAGEESAFEFRWVAGGQPPLFATLNGQLTVRPGPDAFGCILGIEAVASPSTTRVSGMALQPAELVVRSLLGQLRDAFEARTARLV